jgi:hypothetical protein
MVDPRTCKFSVDGDITVVDAQSGSFMKQYIPTNHAQINNWENDENAPTSAPWWAEVYDNQYPFGVTKSHISGAIHAYHFIRFMIALMEIPIELVRGFNVDAIKTSVPVEQYIGQFIDPDTAGYFKAGELKKLEIDPLSPLENCSFHLLSDNHVTIPSQIMMNRAAPTPNIPEWNAHSNRVSSQFTVVYGPAGSGKTTSHFEISPTGVDGRIGNMAYSTYTNFLTHLHARRFNVKGLTSFRAFNRRPDDAKTLVSAKKRFTEVKNTRVIAEIDHLCGYSGVFMDEATMTPNVFDTIEVCKANNLQLILSGDFDRNKCYQLTTESLPIYAEIAKAEAKLGIQFNWIGFDQVFRQVNDIELLNLLTKVRHSNSTKAWQLLESSNLFRTIPYSDLVRDIDPSKDMATYPLHELIGQFTDDVMARLAPDQKFQIRGNFMSPYKLNPDVPLSPTWLARLRLRDDDTVLFKGSVCSASKSEFEILQDTSMCKIWPYDKTNLVNPAIGVTPYTLQGLTIPKGAKLYVLYRKPDDWIRLENGIYTVLSRIQNTDQLVLVKC